MNLALRYGLEFALVIPAAVFAFIPVIDNLKFDALYVVSLNIIFLTAFILTGAYFSSYNIFVSGALILFLVYFFCVDMSLCKKLFCFFNAAMLSSFCPMYTVILTAPIELANESEPFMIESGLVSLVIALLTGIIFFRTLYIKLPVLLKNEYLESVWDYLFILPLAAFVFIYWITPESPQVIMTGRVRPISLVLTLLIPLMIFVLYHVSYFLTARLTESAKLRQENIFLQMESKRYNELKIYLDRTRTLRHDFRQSLLFILQLVDSGRLDELRNYLAELSGSAGLSYKGLCMNNAVDAIASYYDSLALSQDTRVEWKLDLPSSLPFMMKEPDLCVILGNLLENALKAVKDLPVEKRTVKVNASMLSKCMLGFSIENPFDGEIILPGKSSLYSHGLGLASVSNIVERLGGSLSISTENNIFSVGIIIYS